MFFAMISFNVREECCCSWCADDWPRRVVAAAVMTTVVVVADVVPMGARSVFERSMVAVVVVVCK